MKLVEAWSYRLLEDVYYSIADETLPKGAYFIWSGIRNRYEHKTKGGMLVGMTEEQFENDKRFKKVRLPKELRDKVEWSKPKPIDFAPFTGNYIEQERQKIVNRLKDGEYK